MNNSDFSHWFEDGKKILKEKLENNPEMWKKWTTSDKRYLLVCFFLICNNDINATSGTITSYLDLLIYSNRIEDLKEFWKASLIQNQYDNTRQHYIVDLQEKKVIEFMSVCM